MSTSSPISSLISTGPSDSAAPKHRREMESQGSDAPVKTTTSGGAAAKAPPGASSGANKWFKDAAILPPLRASGGLPKPPHPLLVIQHGYVVKQVSPPTAIFVCLDSVQTTSTQPSVSEEAPDGLSSGASTPARATPAPIINISDDDEGPPVRSDGEEAVSAVKSRVWTAAQLAGINIVNARCAQFAQKYAGLTPEQTLGE